MIHCEDEWKSNAIVRALSYHMDAPRWVLQQMEIKSVILSGKDNKKKNQLPLFTLTMSHHK